MINAFLPLLFPKYPVFFYSMVIFFYEYLSFWLFFCSIRHLFYERPSLTKKCMEVSFRLPSIHIRCLVIRLFLSMSTTFIFYHIIIDISCLTLLIIFLYHSYHFLLISICNLRLNKIVNSLFLNLIKN